MTTQIKAVPLDLIDPNPDNPRKDLGDLTDLTASISAQGVQQAPVITPAKNGRYTTIIGHRRLAAAKDAGLKTVTCVIRKYTKRAAAETMLVENTQRQNLTTLEEADGYQRLLDLGETIEQAAKKTGRGETTVRQRVRISAISQTTRQQFGGQPTLDQLDTISAYNNDPDLQARLAQAAGTKNWNYEAKEIKAEAEHRHWYADALKTLKRLGTHPEWELPVNGWYESPRPLRKLTDFTPGKQDFNQALTQWQEKHPDTTPTHVGLRLQGNWGLGIVLYDERDVAAELRTEDEHAQARRQREEQNAAAQQRVDAFSQTAAATRHDFITTLLDRKQPVAKTETMLPLARLTITLMFDEGTSWTQQHEIRENLYLGQPEDHTDNTDEKEGEDDDMGEAPTLASILDGQHDQKAILAACLAWQETGLGQWDNEDALETRIRPYYKVLEALGYQTSQAEKEALDGAYIPATDPDEPDEKEQD